MQRRGWGCTMEPRPQASSSDFLVQTKKKIFLKIYLF